jgi:EAL domain-containing protein (putative c-di-GMP-specific phosphodiesterase class I)
MYRAKEAGRCNYQLFTADMNKQVLQRLTLENNLRKALQEGHFQLYYQPKIDLASMEVSGMEALVRWLHPEGNIIAPDTFIPVAEETGLIIPLGDWILRTACLQTRQWREAGHASLKVAVNLSARQFQQTDLAQKFLAILQETGLPAEALEIEVTESALMANMAETKSTLEQLAACGISIALDDFGTGYSSLYHLKHLPIAAVKIDRSFVTDLTSNADDVAIVRAILSMSADLNLRTVAEGVETAEQLEFLRQHDCSEIQGYLFSRPLPAKEFGRWLVSFQAGRTGLLSAPTLISGHQSI